jgi:hypothetical protein
MPIAFTLAQWLNDLDAIEEAYLYYLWHNGFDVDSEMEPR